MTSVHFALVVHPSVPAKTVKEFIAVARAWPAALPAVSRAPDVDPLPAIRQRCHAAPDTLENRTVMRIARAIEERRGAMSSFSRGPGIPLIQYYWNSTFALDD